MNRLGALVEEVTARRLADGSVRIEAWRPGPAGLSVAHLAEGTVVVAVDTAEPDHVSSILLLEPDRSIGRFDPLLFDRLLDDPTGSALRNWWQGRPSLESEPTVLWSGEPDAFLDDPDMRIRASPRTMATGVLEVGRFAVASDAVARRRLAPGGVALALTEMAALAGVIEASRPQPAASTLMAAAGRHLDRLDPSDDTWLEPLGQDDLVRLFDRLRPWRRMLDGLPGGTEVFERFDRAVRHARGIWGTAAVVRSRLAASPAPLRREAAAAAGPPPPIAAEAAAEPLHDAARKLAHPVDVLLADDVSADVRIIDSAIVDDHLIVHVGGAQEPELWLRAFRPDRPPTILALVPFDEPTLPWRTARAVLPASAAFGRLLVDVTTRPERPWRSPDGNLLLRAVGRGEVAARASRRGDPDAADRWADCADAWNTYGDAERSGRAARLAEYEAAAQQDLKRRFGRNGLEEGPLVIDLFDDTA